MTISAYESDAFQMMEKVADGLMMGKTEYAVAKELGIKRVEVISLHNQWKEMLAADNMASDIARDHLNKMVKHYDRLINESYKILADLKDERFTHQIAAQMNATLKNIADYEARRVDALQKAGVLEGADLGDELAAMEEKHHILIEILRNDLCPDCQKSVATKLQKVTNQVEVIRVD